uniref:Uncharacterized protein n=1 Tax=Peronospora matthiolae TaxID=2874970 RepID=A0AAV1UY50_9STRA
MSSPTPGTPLLYQVPVSYRRDDVAAGVAQNGTVDLLDRQREQEVAD